MKWGIVLPAVAALVATGMGGPAQSRAFSSTYKSKYAQFDFSWSSEAAAIPALARRLRAEMAKEKADTIRGGRQEYAIHVESGGVGIGWATSTKITTSGESARLLSLSRKHYAFTGGAHGNGGTTPLLWDRRLNKEIEFASLFAGRGYADVLHRPFCLALDEERRKRRGGDAQAGGGMYPEFNSCPKLADLALIPADSKHRGRFDTIRLIAAPYLAGPFVEGEYDIALPVSARLIRLMKNPYRASFQAQRQ